MGSRKDILGEVRDERLRQDAKWGQQNHPSLDLVLLNRQGGCTEERMAEHYGIPSATVARQSCDLWFARKEGTWGHILVEEVAEVISCLDDEEAMREELIQTAAVCLNWVEYIDRKKENHA